MTHSFFRKTLTLSLSLSLLWTGGLAALADDEQSLIFPKTISLEEMLKGKVVLTDRNADEPGVLRLSPSRIVGFVETDNIDVAIAKAQEDQARWQFYKSLTHFLPSVDSSLSLEKFTGSDVIVGAQPFDIDRVTWRQRVGISYDVHTGFKPVLEARAYKMQLNGQHKEYDRVHQKALLDALSQYYTWLRDMQGVDTAHQNYQEALAQRRQDEQRERTGFGTQLEVAQSTVKEAEQEQDLLDAHTTQMMSARTLASLLNIPLDYQIEPVKPKLQEANLWVEEEEGTTLPELFEIARDHRPEVKELDYRIKQAKAVFWGTVSDLAPKVRLNAYVGNVGPEPGEYRRMFFRSSTIQFDLLRYMGLEAVTNIAAERARVKEAILKKEQELNRIQDELAKAYYQWYSSRHKIQVSEKKLISAQEAYRISQAREKTGIGIHLEVMEAQSQLGEARQSYFDAIKDYNISQLKLLYETGRLTPDRLLLAYSGDDAPTAELIEAETADKQKPAEDKDHDLTPVSQPQEKSPAAPGREIPATDTPGPKPELSPVSNPQKETSKQEEPANFMAVTAESTSDADAQMAAIKQLQQSLGAPIAKNKKAVKEETSAKPEEPAVHGNLQETFNSRLAASEEAALQQRLSETINKSFGR